MSHSIELRTGKKKTKRYDRVSGECIIGPSRRKGTPVFFFFFWFFFLADQENADNHCEGKMYTVTSQARLIRSGPEIQLTRIANGLRSFSSQLQQLLNTFRLEIISIYQGFTNCKDKKISGQGRKQSFFASFKILLKWMPLCGIKREKKEMSCDC